ncbi:thermonuclease family protein [Marinobacterium sp. D7]|uniref:thermonuclease family protein n=1 Tax=Marinobacterium ramblicola TaxID=2849041 RepID=UPI001C2DBEDC|nr:thermonuclease family protein [Marinobacterium ramblicola]MBV1787388.1 thermonuclease family protein [Marinobacterium ramblicola]
MLLILKKALHWSAFFIVLVPLSQPVIAGCALPPVERQAKVSSVVDGDTLRMVDGDSVRLIGVNTPEIGRKGRSDQPGAREAYRMLERWVQGRMLGVVEGEEPRDRYGRLLAYLSLDGEPLSERLVREGLGYAIAIPPNLLLSDCLFEAEQQARRQRLGLWRDDPVRSAASVNSAGFALVAGGVSKLDLTRNALYLEVDDHLVLRIDRDLIEPDAEAWLRTLLHRRIEVRGWIVDRGRNLKPGRKRWLIGVSDLRHMKLIGG